MTYTDEANLRSILKGKPEQAHPVTLDLCLQAGSLDSQGVWLAQYPGAVQVDIALDGHHVETVAVDTDQRCLSVGLADTTDTQTHALTLTLTGLEPEHHSELNPMLRLCWLRVENLDVMRALETHGRYMVQDCAQVPGEFYGCNGRIELVFETPVYQWLLDNHV